MSKKISGAEYPLAKIFSSDFDYAIPSYQRPYAWTEVQAGDLFSDLYDFFVKEKDDTYFLGSIVLIKDEGKPNAEVIDGQQRLTTLTILLAALTSYFSGDLRSDFENYLREPGRASQGLMPKPRLTLRERDRKFFADYVQNLKFKELIALDPAQLDNESQRNIRRNAELLLQKLDVSFKGATERLCEFGAFLVQRCFLVAVSTPSQQSAFRDTTTLHSDAINVVGDAQAPLDVLTLNTRNLDVESQNIHTPHGLPDSGLLAHTLVLNVGEQALIGRVKSAGGHAEMLAPPDRGIRGNSHMIMQDKNNLQIADLILKWIDERVRTRNGAAQ